MVNVMLLRKIERRGMRMEPGDEGVIKIMDEADLDPGRAAGKPGGVRVGSLDFPCSAWESEGKGREGVGGPCGGPRGRGRGVG